MLVRIMSDLHLEFSGGRLDVPELPNDKDTVLILAGDIGLVKEAYTFLDFIAEMSARFRDVIYILGNHEHYHGSFPTTYSRLKDDCWPYENVHVLEKETIVIDGIAFICATLWTNMNNHDTLCMYQSELMISDYNIIRMGTVAEPWKRKLRAKDTIKDFLNAKHYIFEELKKHDKSVVITHHLPSYESVTEEFKGDPLNGAFASELFGDPCSDMPTLWVHGHTHSSIDYNIGDTRVICNPRGYDTGKELNKDFDISLTVEI